AFLEASIQEEQRLTRGLRPLATIAQIAPLMGLLGTVTGMILAFSEISRQGTGNPAALADGIGQALVTTAAGLIVAIPVLIGHAYLSSRVEHILVDIDRRREELMGNVVQAVAARREESGAAAARSDAARADAGRADALRAAGERSASDVAGAERADVRPAPGLNPLRPASDGS